MTNDPERQARLERLQQRRATTATKGPSVRDESAAERNAHPAARSRRVVLGASALASVGLVVAMGACSADPTSADSTSTSDVTTESSEEATVGGSTAETIPETTLSTTTTTEAPQVTTTTEAPVTSSDAS